MYLGSVRFFKHLIITVTVILIIIPTVLAVLFYYRNEQTKTENVSKDKLIKTMGSTISTYIDKDKQEKLTAEQIYELMSYFKIDDRELVNLLYNRDEHIFDDVLGIKPDIGTTANPNSYDGEYTDSSVPATGEPLPDAEGTTVSSGGGDTGNNSDSPYAKLYPDLYANTPQVDYVDDKNTVYLTFDDGPSENTNDILYYLDKNNVKATFFVIPTATSGEKLRKILEAGHNIGVHTLTHDYKKIYKSVDDYLGDFDKAWNLVYEQTGYKPDIFRFPGGSINDYNTDTAKAIIEEMTRRGFVYFDWNVDSEDSLGATWSDMFNTVPGAVNDNFRSIILFHDRIGGKNTVYVIDDIIRALKKNDKNYIFGKLDKSVRPIQFKIS